jgi:hypothetical protein
MTDTEFADTLTAPTAADTAPAAAETAAAPARPHFIPEKFWDGAAGRVRVEDLAKSYRALEQRMSRGSAPAKTDTPNAEGHAAETNAPPPRPDAAASAVPESALDQATEADGELDTSIPADPADYAVHVSHPWLERDAEIDKLLHAAGFNQAQAQLVYDLAAERVVPVIEAMAAEFEKKLGQARLETHFGGPERFAAIARQVKAWGQRHLPKALYDTLAATPDGIAALHHMMRAGEPRFVGGAGPAGAPTQSELDALVRDPRYWREHDPQLVKRVEEGFRRLYPGA